MDQTKIGNFIAERRKFKKLTQRELAEKLNVTDRSVSNWENGKCLPDYSLFEMLCKELSITLEELLAGEIKNNKDNKSIIKYIKYLSSKQKRKYIFIGGIVFFIMLFMALVFCYFVNNYNKIIVYEIYGNSENFSYTDSLILYSNNKNIITTGNLKINNENINKEDIYLVKFISDETTFLSGNVFVDETTLNVEDSGYNDLLNEDIIRNIDDWKLSIIYRKSGKFYTETINLENVVIMKNNKFVNNSSEKVSVDNYMDNNDYEYELELRNYLLDKGYKENSENLWMSKVDKDENSKGMISIAINVFEGRMIYSVSQDNENYINLNYYLNSKSEKKSNIITASGLSNNEIFNYCFYIKEEEVKCDNGECPADSWQISKQFLTEFEDIINFEVKD